MGPIVVATDGSGDSDAAVQAAWALAARTSADVSILSVIPPITLATELAVLAPLPADFWEEQRAALRDAVSSQLARLLPADCDWPRTTLVGDAAGTIIRFARDAHAALLVTGRGRHGLGSRFLTPETALAILREGSTPVLAVDGGAVRLPKRIVLATDFSEESARAARLALDIADPAVIAYIAHVRPRPPRAGGRTTERWLRSYDDALPTMFERFREKLEAPLGVGLQNVTLDGDPAKALTDFVAASKSDLVVAGTHGLGFIDRLRLGSVSTELLRHAPCSFLGVPPLSADAEAGGRRAL